MRPEDAFVLGHPSFGPHLKGILRDIEEKGDREEAMELFAAHRLQLHRPQLTSDNHHVQALLAAIAEQGVREEMGNWEFAVIYDATVLGITKGGRSPGLARYAKKVWERTARAEAIEDLERAVDRGSSLHLDRISRNACRAGMVTTFAEQCHREGIERLLYIGGPQPELERALGAWPPKRELGTFWGLGDWQNFLAGFISKGPLDKVSKLDEFTLAHKEVWAAAANERRHISKDIRGALRRAERRGTPSEPF